MLILIVTAVVLCAEHKGKTKEGGTSLPSVGHEAIVLQPKQHRYEAIAVVDIKVREQEEFI
jgi:hypothetical protein